ncbi:MAG: AAA family ATPase [Actinomycetota bacterium]
MAPRREPHGDGERAPRVRPPGAVPGAAGGVLGINPALLESRTFVTVKRNPGPEAIRLRSVSFKNFKAFRQYSIRFHLGPNVIIGPNNAGKSTALRALRVVAQMVNVAKHQNPSMTVRYGSGWFRASESCRG